MAYNNSTPPPTPTTPKVLILGCDISVYSKRVQFIICVGGVFIFYVLYGYYQELIFRTDGFKPFGWYLTFIQFIYYTIFSSLESVFILKDTKRRIPLQTYALLAFLTVGTMGMSNASLGYLNYPTQVIFKCCKLIPVMFGGILIQGKKYGVLDFFSCLCMSIGLTCFILADSSLQPSYNYIGIVMMTLALSADAAIGNVQEKAMKTFSATNTEVVLYSYGIGVIYLFLTLLFNGMLLDGFSFFAKHPFATYGYAFIFSLTGYIGISFVLSLIRVFGALLAVTVTTCRKAVSIILSFMMFTKPFTIQYVWSGLIVLLGILLNVYQKNKSVIDVEVLKHLQAASISFGWKRRRRLLETV